MWIMTPLVLLLRPSLGPLELEAEVAAPEGSRMDNCELAK